MYHNCLPYLRSFFQVSTSHTQWSRKNSPISLIVASPYLLCLKVDGQAPLRAVQCLPTDTVLSIPEGMVLHKLWTTMSPTSPRNRTSPPKNSKHHGFQQETNKQGMQTTGQQTKKALRAVQPMKVTSQWRTRDKQRTSETLMEEHQDLEEVGQQEEIRARRKKSHDREGLLVISFTTVITVSWQICELR